MLFKGDFGGCSDCITYLRMKCMEFHELWDKDFGPDSHGLFQGLRKLLPG
jgi:hypothetical protein